MHEISSMVEQFAAGRLSRRELVWGLTALVAAAAERKADAVQAPSRGSTFQALGLNHLALRVTDLDRSQAFYEWHLGMTRIPSAAASPRLMACGPPICHADSTGGGSFSWPTAWATQCGACRARGCRACWLSR